MFAITTITCCIARKVGASDVSFKDDSQKYRKCDYTALSSKGVANAGETVALTSLHSTGKRCGKAGSGRGLRIRLGKVPRLLLTTLARDLQRSER